MPPVHWIELSSTIKELTFQHTVDRFIIDPYERYQQCSINVSVLEINIHSNYTSIMYPNNHSTETNRNQNRAIENPRMKAKGIWGRGVHLRGVDGDRKKRKTDKKKSHSGSKSRSSTGRSRLTQSRPTAPPKEEEDEGGR